MHGLGDNVHQRAILRQLIERHDVYLETSWAAIYHDLIPLGLKCMRKSTNLRTQRKNQDREAGKFWQGQVPPGTPAVHIMYHGFNVQQQPSHTILEAMCKSARVDYARADFSLPIPGEWFQPVDQMIAQWRPRKPILFYRPLVSRPEWRGSMVRNADPLSYAEIFAAIRDYFFVVSIADLAPTREWITGPRLKADVAIHEGELPFESLAALMARSALCYTSSGFGSVLAPAVGTPCINVVGGYERAVWHDHPLVLGIEPITPCQCATSACGKQCDKVTDIIAANDKVRNFLINQNLHFSAPAENRPFSEMFDPAGPEPGSLRRPTHAARNRAWFEARAKIGLKA